MKKITFLILLFLPAIIALTSCGAAQKKEEHLAVNPDLFLTNDTSYTIETVDATLINGVKTKCYKITTIGLTPTDHVIGPWCPEYTSDNSDKGGIWFKDGKIYDVDGEFIINLPTLYHDDFWKLHDDEGNVNKTMTKEDCLELVGAKLVEKFKNYCIECLPSYIAEIKKTYIIPIIPVKLDKPIALNSGPKGKPDNGHPPKGRPKGPPPGGDGKNGGPIVRGVAFNGIPFDAPAPLHIILGGYSIPPLDDAGGHINLDAGYHYHAATGHNTTHSHNDKHAAMIGYAMDGFGLYEQLNSDGKEPKDLDECRGHYDKIRGYHYHVDAPGSNNFINCFSGAIAKE